VAEKRDILDDLIDIQADWHKISNPFGDIADSLAEDPSKRKVFNPADYKEKPWCNSNRCLRTASERDDVCSRCFDVCPTHAITIHKKSVNVSDDLCRKCGLCVAACPTEAFLTRKHTSRSVYDQIARAASSYEECYVTCTRAIKRLPKGNEIVLPCVGLISKELWFSLLADYVNINVYLPVGICDKCRTITGEDAYVDAIGTAEEWSAASVGLEVENGKLTHELTREYKRSQFVSSAIKSTERLLSRTNPALAGAQAVAKKISDHSKRLDTLQKQLENAVGLKTSNNRTRLLTQDRKLMMGALQHAPELAKNIDLKAPVVDSSLCSMCGDCANACPTHAIDIDKDGNVTVQNPYCVNCGACVTVCPDDALTMETFDASELVIPDKDAEEIARQKAKAKSEAQKYLETGKKQLNKVGDALERMGDDSKSE